jgi:alanyl-tRNA synthetase
VLDSTCFYAESGGQTGDQGLLVVGDAVVEVADVQTFGGYSLHLGHVVSGSIKVLLAFIDVYCRFGSSGYGVVSAVTARAMAAWM